MTTTYVIGETVEVVEGWHKFEKGKVICVHKRGDKDTLHLLRDDERSFLVSADLVKRVKGLAGQSDETGEEDGDVKEG